MHIYIDTHVRLIGCHRRPHTGALTELVDNRIFDLERAVMGMGDRRTIGVEIHRQGPVLVEMRSPIDTAHAGIQRLRCRRGKLRERQQHTIGHPRPQANPVGQRQIAIESHSGARFLHIPGAKRAQFIGEQGLDAARGGGEQAQG